MRNLHSLAQINISARVKRVAMYFALDNRVTRGDGKIRVYPNGHYDFWRQNQWVQNILPIDETANISKRPLHEFQSSMVETV